jgi:hypothetical protein
MIAKQTYKTYVVKVCKEIFHKPFQFLRGMYPEHIEIGIRSYDKRDQHTNRPNRTTSEQPGFVGS